MGQLTSRAARFFARPLQRLGVMSTKRFVSGLELTLTVALGAVIALFLYALLAPLPAPKELPVAGAPRTAAVATAVRNNVNPFRPAIVTSADAAYDPADEEETLEETDLNLVLHGVRVDASDRTAIIRLPNGEQKIFRVGDEILSGVVLNDAYQDQVTITRNGVRETLTLVNRDPKTARAARMEARTAASETQRAPAATNPALRADNLGDITNFIRIAPTTSDQGLRIVLNPGPDASFFRASGLSPGDALIEIDGKNVTRDIASTVSTIQALAPGAKISLTVERDGALVPLNIQVPQFKSSTN